LTRYLSDYARERGFRPVGEPKVELAEDASLRVGSVRVDARFVDVEPAQRAALEDAVAGTRRLRLAELAAARGPAAAPVPSRLWLTDGGSLRYPLDPDSGVVRIGRARDNDVAIDKQRVSRYHAQARWIESVWLVYDLDSTNGTYIDNERIIPARPRPLR